MKDVRLYGKFTLDFPDSPKILPLSDAAFRCLVEATLWSRKQMTDGVLARRLALAKWPLDVLQELASNDEDNPSLIETDEGWIIHDFAAHQDTRAEIEARSARNKAAGQKGGQARAKRAAKRAASAALSETQAETETETETHRSTDVDLDAHPTSPASSSAAYSAEFSEWWSHYPRKTGKGAAAKAYAKAPDTTETLLDGVRRYAADPNLPDPQFIPHASTWLNERRWDDGPLPPRDRPAHADPSRSAWDHLKTDTNRQIGA